MTSSYANEQRTRAGRLKERLLQKYQGCTIDGLPGGALLQNDAGCCLCLKSRHQVGWPHPTPASVRRVLKSELRLIDGIESQTEGRLRRTGFETIEDLAEHPLYQENARRFLDLLDREDHMGVIRWVERGFSPSHPLALTAAGLRFRNDFLFFDIETLGLKDQPVILIGVGQTEGKELVVRQYLPRNLEEERAVLRAFSGHVRPDSVLVSFNGRHFDAPYVQGRLAYHGLPPLPVTSHLDLLLFARRAWYGMVPNCRLGTLERHILGIHRVDDVPSALVPEFYLTYLQSGNMGPVVPIVTHNRQDIVTLAALLSKLSEEGGEEKV